MDGVLTCEDDENPLFFEDVELSDVGDGDDLDGNLGLVPEVGEVHSIIRPIHHAVPIIYDRPHQSTLS
jgi:hypothetical protein